MDRSVSPLSDFDISDTGGDATWRRFDWSLFRGCAFDGWEVNILVGPGCTRWNTVAASGRVIVATRRARGVVFSDTFVCWIIGGMIEVVGMMFEGGVGRGFLFDWSCDGGCRVTIVWGGIKV